MMDSKQLRKHIINPTLEYLGMYSEAASNLLMGTCAQESAMGKYIRQIGCDSDVGAFGIYQMELATHNDIYNNYLQYRESIESKILGIRSEMFGLPCDDLMGNLYYSTALARVHYYRVPESLPQANDIHGLANYWKNHYNSKNGKGTVDEFIENYFRYVK